MDQVIRWTDFEVPGWGEFGREPVAWASFAAWMRGSQPRAWWRLGELSGSVAREEMSGLDGAHLAGVTPGEAGAIVHDADRGALYSESKDVYTALPRDAVQVEAGWSFGLWFRCRGVAIELMQQIEYAGGWAIYYSGDTLFQIHRFSDGTYARYGVTGGQDGGWHHAVATLDGQLVPRLYLDGAEAASGPALKELSVASRDGQLGFRLDGWIDEPAMWQRKLGEEEIRGLYEAGAGVLRL